MSHDPALKPAVPRSVVPNCQFRSKTSRLKTFTANQLDEIKDPSGLFYILPFQKVRSKVQGAGPPGVRVLGPRGQGAGRWGVTLWLCLPRGTSSTGMCNGRCGTTCLGRS